MEANFRQDPEAYRQLETERSRSFQNCVLHQYIYTQCGCTAKRRYEVMAKLTVASFLGCPGSSTKMEYERRIKERFACL